MKRTLGCFFLLALLLLTVGCQARYYHEESSATLSVESLEDTVPPYVFGENGFYDTGSDAEYLLVPDVRVKERGDELFTSDDGRTFYQVAGVSESFLIADGSGNLYKNALIDWIDPPGEPGWVNAYPALEWRGNAD